MSKKKPRYDKEYIDALIAKATPTLQDVDADEYVRSIREGTYGEGKV